MNTFAHSPLCRCLPCRDAAFQRCQHDERVRILRAYRKGGGQFRVQTPDGAFLIDLGDGAV